MAATVDRASRLKSLAESTKKWAQEERDSYNAVLARCKSLLKGRTGSERLNQSLVAATSDIAQDEINAFLTSLLLAAKGQSHDLTVLTTTETYRRR